MLQVDQIYHFLFDTLFMDFRVCHLLGGVPTLDKEITLAPYVCVYAKSNDVKHSVFFYDQEPLFPSMTNKYLNLYEMKYWQPFLITSEKSDFRTDLYYFFHGFAALDWFRGFYALNHNEPVIRTYKKDYITFNRTITGDRAYRKTFVERLRSEGLLDKGLVSYGVVDEHSDGERLVIDGDHIPASASATIPTSIDSIGFEDGLPDYNAFWHIVTETVFYHDKLHLTEKIFKPIVMKQPFMLLAAPGNLEYLKSYGFKTFDRWIDESYDTITDHEKRIEAVVEQIKWWTNLTEAEKLGKMCVMEEVIEYNFHHFYGKFKEIITDELLNNTKKLFKDIGYNDRKIDYDTVRKLIIS